MLSAEKVLISELDGSGDGDILTGGVKAEAAGVVARISVLSEPDGPIIFAAVPPFDGGSPAAKTDAPAARQAPPRLGSARSTLRRCYFRANCMHSRKFVCQSSLFPAVLCVRDHTGVWR